MSQAEERDPLRGEQDRRELGARTWLPPRVLDVETDDHAVQDYHLWASDCRLYEHPETPYANL